MTGSSLVVADTTPLNYLTIIGQIHALGALFEKVLVPEGVLAKLSPPKARDVLAHWSRSLPKWVQVACVREMDHTIPFGKGEADAFSLALEKQVGIVLGSHGGNG